MNKRIRKKFLKAAACWLGYIAPDGSIMRDPWQHHFSDLLPNGHPQQQRKVKRRTGIMWYGLARGAYGKRSAHMRKMKTFCADAEREFPTPAWKGGYYRFYRRPLTLGA